VMAGFCLWMLCRSNLRLTWRTWQQSKLSHDIYGIPSGKKQMAWSNKSIGSIQIHLIKK
jgi:hypothetical protein